MISNFHILDYEQLQSLLLSYVLTIGKKILIADRHNLIVIHLGRENGETVFSMMLHELP